MSLCLDIQVACAGPVPADQQFRSWIAAALAGHRERAEISLRLVDEPEMQTLNRTYRGKDCPTNVLSFPADLPPELALDHLGDIVIAAAVVAREAREQGKPAMAHWAHMTVHGTLHLLGFDHVEEPEAQAMEALEKTILAELGFSDPYRDDADGEPSVPSQNSTAFGQEESTQKHG